MSFNIYKVVCKYGNDDKTFHAVCMRNDPGKQYYTMYTLKERLVVDVNFLPDELSNERALEQATERLNESYKDISVNEIDVEQWRREWNEVKVTQKEEDSQD